VAVGSDQSGYFNHARLLSEHRLHAPVRSLDGLPALGLNPYLHVPLGMKPAPDGNGMVPTYPPGLPLFIAAAAAIVGWGQAGEAVILLHALSAVLLTYALGRSLGLGRRTATLGAVVIATSPLVLSGSLQAMSDVPAMAWTTAAVLAAWASREQTAWALAAGFALSVDVLIRPTNVLALLPAALALGTAPRRWVPFILGGIPGAAASLAHSHAAYGSALTTGYGYMGDYFSLGRAPMTLAHSVCWLPVLFTPLALLCAGLPALAGAPRGSRGVLGSWILAYVLFFSAYSFTDESWAYQRFLLPAAPAIVVAALKVARRIAGRFPMLCAEPRATRAFRTALCLAVLSGAGSILVLHAWSSGLNKERHVAAARWLGEHAPEGSGVLCMGESGALFYYEPGLVVVRFDEMDPDSAARVASACRTAGRPLYADLLASEVGEALQRRMPGSWTRLETLGDVTLWRREDR
jgi:hypothetical protein